MKRSRAAIASSCLGDFHRVDFRPQLRFPSNSFGFDFPRDFRLLLVQEPSKAQFARVVEPVQGEG